MKRYLLLLTCFIFFKTNAQNLKPLNWCGASLSKDQIDWLDDYQRNSAKYNQAKADPPRWIPVKAHIVGKDDSTGYYRLDYLFTAICELNQRYANINFHFFIYKDIDYINNTDFYEDGTTANKTARILMKNNNLSEALNIYFLNIDPALCGYYTPGTDNVVIFGANCGIPGGTTITHEVGHYFSLPHTFYGWEGSLVGCNQPGSASQPLGSAMEKVNGTNCATAADKFCDTKADYLPYRWQCPYTCNYKDPNGALIRPDSSLYMSYADDACTNRFSTEQQLAMKANVTSGPNKKFTLNSAQNDKALLTSPQLIFPDQNSFEPSNYTVFRWRKVAGADAYCIAINKKFKKDPAQAHIVTDTFFIVNNNNPLLPNEDYQWQVNAFQLGHPCNAFSAKVNFTTGDVTGINDMPKMKKINIAISPMPIQKNGELMVTAISEIADNLDIQIFNASGNLIFQTSKEINSGKNLFSINNLNLISGYYMCKIVSANFTTVKKIIVQ